MAISPQTMRALNALLRAKRKEVDLGVLNTLLYVAYANGRKQRKTRKDVSKWVLKTQQRIDRLLAFANGKAKPAKAAMI